MNKYILLLLSCGLSFSSCDQTDDSTLKENKKISILADKMLIEQQVDRLYLLCYQSCSSMPDVFTMPVDADGSCVFNKPSKKYEKQIVMGGHSLDLEMLKRSSYDGVKQLTTVPSDYKTTLPQLYWTAEIGDQFDKPIALQKSVYKVDVNIKSARIVLDSCIIDRVADKTFILPCEELGSEHIAYRSVCFDFTAAQNEGIQGSGFWGYESEVAPLLRLYVKENGVPHIVETALETAVERNKIYDVTVNEVDGEIKTTLKIRDWENGGSIVIGPDEFLYKVDKSNSIFPSYVRLSREEDTIYVPSCDTELILAIDTDIETDIRAEGSPLRVERVEGSDYLSNTFRINVTQKGILDPETRTNLFFAEKGSGEFDRKPIVIVQEPSRLKLTSQDVATDGALVIYPDYMDGTLATVKQGFSVSSYLVGSDAEQYQWVTVLRKNGAFTVEGAFKPNDRQATGQRQESAVTVIFSDGVEEEYTFSRVRTALPVVKFGEKYWSKYNMRGNSKAVTDQIGFDKDQTDLWAFLKSCSDDQYLYYAGDEYCGTNTQGLSLEKNAQGKLVYRGYPEAFGSSSILDTKADTHCPSGYEVPTEADLRGVISSSVVHLFPLQRGEEEEDAYLNKKERYTVNRYRRPSLTKDGVGIEDVYHIRISNPQGESIVLNGLGFQAEPGSVAWGYWLFANVTNAREFAGFNHRGNNFYMQSHSGKKTNMVRCVKKPVSFVL